MKIATVRKQSQRLISLDGKFCAQCGSTKRLQRHHKEYSAESVVILCQECHKELHMKDGTWGEGLKQTKDCVICGKPFVPNHSTKHKTCSKNCFSELGRRNAMKRWGKTEQTDCEVSEMR